MTGTHLLLSDLVQGRLEAGRGGPGKKFGDTEGKLASVTPRWHAYRAGRLQQIDVVLSREQHARSPARWLVGDLPFRTGMPIGRNFQREIRGARIVARRRRGRKSPRRAPRLHPFDLVLLRRWRNLCYDGAGAAVPVGLAGRRWGCSASQLRPMRRGIGDPG